MGSIKRFGRITGDLGLGLLGLFAGVAVFLAFQATIGGAANDSDIAPLVVLDIPEAGPGAVSPEAAVASFLAAEAAGDSAAAFDLLSAADRQSHGSAQHWAARSPLGDVTGWQWSDQEALTTVVALEGSLSLTSGWSPAATTITWAVVDEDGWRIDLADSVARPDHLDPEGAVEAAASWLKDPRRCDTDTLLALAPPSPAFDRLCVTGGVLASNASSPVGGQAAVDLALAYGADAPTWARSVPVEGGLELIVAEVAGRWLVIDAAAP